jgi:diguanylate cyclase (GGDEF)-like protein
MSPTRTHPVLHAFALQAVAADASGDDPIRAPSELHS